MRASNQIQLISKPYAVALVSAFALKEKRRQAKADRLKNEIFTHTLALRKLYDMFSIFPIGYRNKARGRIMPIVMSPRKL